MIFFLFVVLLLPITSSSANEQQEESAGDADESTLEVVIVSGVRSRDALELNISKVTQPGVDNSELLRLFPGGNRNNNGPISRISQYRGLFGAHNNVSIDGQTYTSGGPNWMDSPLSSIPRSLTQSVTLYRGLGSVVTVAEGLGGSIEMTARNEGFSNEKDWSTFGLADISYGHNAHSLGTALYLGAHNQNNWLDLAVSMDQGDDYEFNGGTVSTSLYDREQYRLAYGHRFTWGDINLGAVINRTGESGTPALPMDILFVDSEQYSFGLDAQAGEGGLALRANTLAVTHVMNNFSLRPPPTNPSGMKSLRQTLAVGNSNGFKLTYDMDMGSTELLFGMDAQQEKHDADITDPGKDMFYITNFNAVARDRTGVFMQANRALSGWDFEGGLRYNRVDMDAGKVGGNLAMMPMGGMMSVSQQDRLDELAQAFNESDRKQKDDQWSGTLKASHRLGDTSRLNLGLGRKARSPSYQERYLWLPMEATAGLADGFTYIGDINLKPETSIEFTAGIDWSLGSFELSPEAYFRDVKNYIQGVPSTNMTANMFALMMGGSLPLQFVNVNAEFYGLDLAYEYAVSEAWILRGNLGYVRGKRVDVEDNLYRIAPLSSFLELTFNRERYFVSLESIASSKQNKVSAYNNEKSSAGWGIANLRCGFSLGSMMDIHLGVENIFDKAYQDHLGGYNRVADSDVSVGERLYSTGRNYYIRLNANW